MARILVLGAGICGLATAMLLARDGHDVVVLERDAEPTRPTPDEAWTSWSRGGVAQFRQPHLRVTCWTPSFPRSATRSWMPAPWPLTCCPGCRSPSPTAHAVPETSDLSPTRAGGQ